MSNCIFRDGTVVSDFGRPYIVAEVNSSHNGKMDVAKAMIDSAVEIGADCVKFQSWSVESLYSKTYYDLNPISKRFVTKFSLRPEQLKELANYCKVKGIQFSSTPYSEEEVDFLVDECDVPYIKIASMELNNPKFLRYIGGKNVPIVLSTGMSDIEEIQRGVKNLKDSGATQMTILHCVSIYPTDLTTVNLNNIIGLREAFSEFPIGFSDHTEGDAAAVAATALGAALIEKHLTLDHSKVGMDNGMATEPTPFKELVNKCREIQIAMGTKERIVSETEIQQRTNMRRSIIAVRDLPKGTVIKEEDLYAKRPGTGICPDKIAILIGKKTTRDIEADTLLMPEDFE
ncbi:N-acetylneuraminate synthase family protein [Ruminococcus sp. OA3]|uniref:N-acetylneuraminate synthase family protein n=1 Tax=Ruminococcus sp. OA3 TaxID=2914164 RepID=UPI001F065AE5|nr:N-acetylneuraminate synthase family protein [Ruminococcus sp. OA3]MCH1982912.1 N-acetylneuraminate synthase family protein [Ruminococcus sp. OA3]